MGCHGTEDEAIAQMRALYAAEDKKLRVLKLESIVVVSDNSLLEQELYALVIIKN